jgi:hypothetical protein
MPPEETVYRIRDAFMHHPALTFQHFYGNPESGWGFALQYRLLSVPPSSFFIS